VRLHTESATAPLVETQRSARATAPVSRDSRLPLGRRAPRGGSQSQRDPGRGTKSSNGQPALEPSARLPVSTSTTHIGLSGAHECQRPRVCSVFAYRRQRTCRVELIELLARHSSFVTTACGLTRYSLRALRTPWISLGLFTDADTGHDAVIYRLARPGTASPAPPPFPSQAHRLRGPASQLQEGALPRRLRRPQNGSK
jgi:hypothetical protein